VIPDLEEHLRSQIRGLSADRDRWKQKAKEAEARTTQMQEKLEQVRFAAATDREKALQRAERLIADAADLARASGVLHVAAE
jgi:hypothetical protein